MTDPIKSITAFTKAKAIMLRAKPKKTHTED